MDNFSIYQLQQFSGIKAHTIRIWEQRYNALHPTRSEGNTRYYDNTQLKRLLNIVSLMNDGHKVSKLCTVSDETLHHLIDLKINNNTQENSNNEYFVSQLILAATTFNETYFEKIFSKCLRQSGIRNTYIEVVYPMLNRIGIMWKIDTISTAHEHFCTNLIKQKIYTAIDALPPLSENADTWMLFLPENEFHEIGLLFANYLLRLSGKKVIYLGSNIPLTTLVSAVATIQPTHLYLFFVHYNSPEDAKEYLNQLTTNFKHVQLHLSGNEKLILQLDLDDQVNWIRSVEDLEKQLSL
jgi:hypothetical protein